MICSLARFAPAATAGVALSVVLFLGLAPSEVGGSIGRLYGGDTGCKEVPATCNAKVGTDCDKQAKTGCLPDSTNSKTCQPKGWAKDSCRLHSCPGEDMKCE